MNEYGWVDSVPPMTACAGKAVTRLVIAAAPVVRTAAVLRLIHVRMCDSRSSAAGPSAGGHVRRNGTGPFRMATILNAEGIR
ncbi:hypothetical protein GCM10020229_35160 [Kitasatospora albolonga]